MSRSTPSWEVTGPLKLVVLLLARAVLPGFGVSTRCGGAVWERSPGPRHKSAVSWGPPKDGTGQRALLSLLETRPAQIEGSLVPKHALYAAT